MNIFVFDIETVPDVANLRKIYELPDSLSASDVVFAVQTLRRQEGATSGFMPLHLHRIVTISAVLQTPDTLKVWSLGNIEALEKEIISRFFMGIEKYTPILISWNGSGFDLPVLHYRSLLHGVAAPRYWETGESEPNFRYNNYLNRYHYRHTDLMDVFAAYQARANAKLDDIATMIGAPGKMGMDGSKVWESFQANDIETIRNYCETDVLNTYLVYLRYELLRGNFTAEEYEIKCMKLRNYLHEEGKPHLVEFANHWQ